MALRKKVRQDDGVTTVYHRILFLQTTTNQQNSIAVTSYVDETSRAEEIVGDVVQPYRRTTTYETAYDETMTVSTAYDYLKTLPQFEGAEDI